MGEKDRNVATGGEFVMLQLMPAQPDTCAVYCRRKKQQRRRSRKIALELTYMEVPGYALCSIEGESAVYPIVDCGELGLVPTIQAPEYLGTYLGISYASELNEDDKRDDEHWTERAKEEGLADEAPTKEEPESESEEDEDQDQDSDDFDEDDPDEDDPDDPDDPDESESDELAD